MDGQQTLNLTIRVGSTLTRRTNLGKVSFVYKVQELQLSLTESLSNSKLEMETWQLERKHQFQRSGNLNTEECMFHIHAVGSSILPYSTNFK